MDQNLANELATYLTNASASLCNGNYTGNFQDAILALVNFVNLVQLSPGTYFNGDLSQDALFNVGQYAIRELNSTKLVNEDTATIQSPGGKVSVTASDPREYFGNIDNRRLIHWNCGILRGEL